MIYKIYDERNKYRGYKTSATINQLTVPWSVNGVLDYHNGISICYITAFYRKAAEEAITTRIALNNIITRQELLDQLNFNI